MAKCESLTYLILTFCCAVVFLVFFWYLYMAKCWSFNDFVFVLEGTVNKKSSRAA